MRSRQTKQQTTQIQTAQVERGTLIITVGASGAVSSSNSRTVSTNVSGVVKKVYVQNDQYVKEGDKLVDLELDQESKQSYTQALASYQSAKNALSSAQATLYTTQATMFTKWDDFKELAESDTYDDAGSVNRNLPEFKVSENTWLASEAQYKNQQAAIAQAQTSLQSSSQSLRLSSPTIYAPISGKVSGLSLMEGVVLSTEAGTTTGQTIANIVTDARATVEISLTEIDMTKVKLNNKVTMTLDALPDKTYTGKVMSIDTVGSVSSGVTSYPAVIVFDTSVPEIFSNMSVEANIITQTKTDVLVIPSSALQKQNESAYVRVMKNGAEKQVTVETGISSGTQVEIVSGLSEGDVIVISSVQTSTTKSSTQSTSPFGNVRVGGMSGGGIPH